MENLFTLSAIAIGAIPVVVGLVAVVKSVGLPSRFAPVASIAVGIGLLSLTGLAWQAFVVQGIIVGLAASGLWSGGKALFAPEG
jgi:hypothetical protein